MILLLTFLFIFLAMPILTIVADVIEWRSNKIDHVKYLKGLKL